MEFRFLKPKTVGVDFAVAVTGEAGVIGVVGVVGVIEPPSILLKDVVELRRRHSFIGMALPLITVEFVAASEVSGVKFPVLRLREFAVAAAVMDFVVSEVKGY